MGPTWGQQDGPHVGPMKIAIWDILDTEKNFNHLSTWYNINAVNDINQKFLSIIKAHHIDGLVQKRCNSSVSNGVMSFLH